jgi:hypothetical protein
VSHYHGCSVHSTAAASSRWRGPVQRRRRCEADEQQRVRRIPAVERRRPHRRPARPLRMSLPLPGPGSLSHPSRRARAPGSHPRGQRGPYGRQQGASPAALFQRRCGELGCRQRGNEAALFLFLADVASSARFLSSCSRPAQRRVK